MKDQVQLFKSETLDMAIFKLKSTTKENRQLKSYQNGAISSRLSFKYNFEKELNSKNESQMSPLAFFLCGMSGRGLLPLTARSV